MYLRLSIDFQALSGSDGELQRSLLPGGTLPLPIDSSGSFELVKLLHEESCHQAFEQGYPPCSKPDFMAQALEQL